MADKKIRIKDTGAVFNVPTEFYEKVNGSPLSLKQYAVQSGQLSHMEAFNREPEFKPEADGPVDAALIGAGRTLDRLGSNVMQAFSSITGNEEGVERQKEKQREIERLAAPVKEDHPVASFAGEALPYFAAPGGKVAQVLFGAAEGALEGDNLDDRLTNAAIGSLAAFGGQKVGDKLGDATKSLFGRIRNTPDAQARRQLMQAGVPLTLSQKGSPIAKFFERMRFVLSRRQPLADKQVRSMNKLAAKAIGEKADTLDKAVLNRAHSRIGNVFEDVAQSVDDIQPSKQNLDALQKILGKVKSEGFDTPRVGKASEQLTELMTSQDLNGKTLLDARSKLGKLSRQLWSKGEGLDAELVDDMIQVLDDTLASAAPAGRIDDLAKARAQWRFLRALRTGKAIDNQGDLNFNSMDSAMRRVFPGFEVGKLQSGNAADFGKSLDAIRRLQQPPRSSGTAENLITAAALPALGFAASGGEGEGAAGGLSLALLGLSGGGAGGQLGGAAARALANQLAQERQKAR